MKYSNSYFFYPSSNELLKGIAHYKTLVGNQDDADDAIDSSITSHDVFLYTRGNFEQRLYNGNVFKVASEELKTKLSKSSGRIFLKTPPALPTGVLTLLAM